MTQISALWANLDWQGLWYAAVTCLALSVVHFSSVVFYNLFFHPLHAFPGPRLAAATPVYHAVWTMLGKKHILDQKLHAKYGDVVRIKPNQLSFIGEEAWRDIYMHRQGQPQMAKWGRGRTNNKGAYSIINAPDDIHARQRKSLSHAFSEKALREQESLITTYVDSLIANIRQDAREGRPSNMALYYNWTTFDIIGDLSFAQSFDALKTRTTHPWIKTFFSQLELVVVVSELLHIPILGNLLKLFLYPIIVPLRKRLSQYCDDSLQKRREAGHLDRPDFLGKVMQQNSEKGKKSMMSDEEMNQTFQVLMVAGSETTATTLAGCTYLLQKNPRVLETLQREIRAAFHDEKDINMLSVNKLPYLLAVIEEALRLYPPVPISFARQTPASGANICGHHVPGGAVVAISQRTASYSSRYFVDPHDFVPERFLAGKEAKFENDQRSVLQPFSAGPRNCLGRNLAYAEMKLVLARIIYNFDLELVDKESDWMDQKVYILWIKPELKVMAKERNVRVNER